MSKTILMKDIPRGVQWKATVNGATVTYEWGRIGGTQQTDSNTFTVGKNVGKANETTPEQQCMAEAMVKVRKKMEKGYVVVSGALDAPVATTSDLTIPKPMKAQDLHDHQKKISTWDMVWYQNKLNGNRCTIDITNGKMYSSSRKEITHLGLIGLDVQKACATLQKDCAHLQHIYKKNPIRFVDGELYCHGMSINAIQTLVRRVSGDTKIKKGDEIDTPEKFKAYKERLQFHMFDIVCDEPWSTRVKMLSFVPESEKLKVTPSYYDSATKLREYIDKFVAAGYEGAIVRLPDFTYESKKSLGIFKWKDFFDAEFKVVGFSSERLDSNKLGAVVVQLDSDPSVTFEATPKKTDEWKADVWAHQDEYIGQWAKVQFQNRDDKSNIPIFPVMLDFRDPDDMSEEE